MIRCLATDDGYPLTALNVQRHTGKQGESGEGHGQILCRQNIISADHVGGQGDVHGGIYLLRFFQYLDLGEHFLAALGTLDGFFTVEGF